MSGLGDVLGPHAPKMAPADEKAARAAMGITDEATIVPMDMTRSPLFVCVFEDDNGDLQVMARSTLPRPVAASLLRQVADSWDERE